MPIYDTIHAAVPMLAFMFGTWALAFAWYGGRALGAYLLRLPRGSLFDPPPAAYLAVPRWRRALGHLSGPAAAYLAPALVLFVGLLDAERVPTMHFRVFDDSPAARAGLRTGDRLEALHGKQMHSWNDVELHLRGPVATSARLDARRAGEPLAVEVQLDPAHKRLGVLPLFEARELTLAGAAQRALSYPLDVSRRFLRSVRWAVAGGREPTIAERIMTVTVGATEDAAASHLGTVALAGAALWSFTWLLEFVVSRRRAGRLPPRGAVQAAAGP